MALSLYDVTVPKFLQTLGGVAHFLERGRAHCEDNGIALDDIVQTRLFENMLPFHFQVVSVVHHTQGAIEGAKAGVFSPGGPQGTFDYAGLQGLVADAQQALLKVAPAEVDELEGGDLIFKLGSNQLPFVTEQFLLSFSIPNLHFHATTAYDILRMKGAPLGKRDYLGALPMKTGD